MDVDFVGNILTENKEIIPGNIQEPRLKLKVEKQNLEGNSRELSKKRKYIKN